MDEHQNETGNDDDSREPPEGVSHADLPYVHGPTINKDFSQNKSHDQSAAVRVIIDSDGHQADGEKEDDGTDQAGPQLTHERATALRRDGEHRANKA